MTTSAVLGLLLFVALVILGLEVTKNLRLARRVDELEGELRRAKEAYSRLSLLLARYLSWMARVEGASGVVLRDDMKHAALKVLLGFEPEARDFCDRFSRDLRMQAQSVKDFGLPESPDVMEIARAIEKKYEILR